MSIKTTHALSIMCFMYFRKIIKYTVQRPLNGCVHIITCGQFISKDGAENVYLYIVYCVCV